MQKHKIYLLLTLWLFLLTSCINEIPFDESQMNPVLVVNCLATPDTVMKVNLSRTKFFLSSASGYETVTDYTVKLWLNGVFKEQMLLKNNQYQSKYKPKKGDKMSLYIYKQDTTYSIARAFSAIPVGTPVLGVDTGTVLNQVSFLVNDSAHDAMGKIFSDTLAKIENKRFSYAIHFRDSAALENFYRVKIFIYHTGSDGKVVRETLRVRPDDAVFDRKNESEIFDNDWDRMFNIFTDRQINGQSYAVKLYGNLNQVSVMPGKKALLAMAGYTFPVKSELVVDLMGIDEALYNYLKTIKYNNTDLQYFSEPVQIFTNISGGTGIFGCYTHSYFRIVLPVDAGTYFSR